MVANGHMHMCKSNTSDSRGCGLGRAFIRQKVSVRVLKWNPWTDLGGIYL